MIALTFEGGAKGTAVQTLRAYRMLHDIAKRPDCGAFTAAFLRGQSVVREMK